MADSQWLKIGYNIFHRLRTHPFEMSIVKIKLSSKEYQHSDESSYTRTRTYNGITSVEDSRR